MSQTPSGAQRPDDQTPDAQVPGAQGQGVQDPGSRISGTQTQAMAIEASDAAAGPFWHKGSVSNMLSLLVLLAGVTMVLELAGTPPAWLIAWGPWIMAVGVFGFAGGITNWLAVKMLFDRVPGLYGSGVIPARFREIRATIKNLIMAHFFDEEYLQRFFNEHGTELGGGPGVLTRKLGDLLASDEAGRAIEWEIEKLKEGPYGMVVRMAGTEMLMPLIQQFLGGLIERIGPMAEAKMREDLFDVVKLRSQVDRLLETKLEELTPEIVKRMMEKVMRKHLGWLIVWGNVFGGLIGLLSKAMAVQYGIQSVP
ncbi:MAG: hypothetical protein HN712_03775 [Gemmatimonadetes bacterium]|nr:hypothetical protein [Gemmatimonadota bacterium]